jgi:hypothetical protein
MIASAVGTVAPSAFIATGFVPTLGGLGTIASVGVTVGLTLAAVTTAFEAGIVIGAAIGAAAEVNGAFGPYD